MPLSCGAQRRPRLAGPCGQGAGHQWGTLHQTLPQRCQGSHAWVAMGGKLRHRDGGGWCWGGCLQPPNTFLPCWVGGSLAQRWDPRFPHGMHDAGGHVAGAWVPTLSRPSCTQPGGAGGQDAPRAHPSLRAQPGPMPGCWHPAWGGLAPRRYSPPARAGLRFPGGLAARGELPEAPPGRKCLGRFAGLTLLRDPGHTQARGWEPVLAAAGDRIPSQRSKRHPLPLLPSLPDTRSSRGGRVGVPAKLQPCSGVGQSRLDGRAGSRDGDRDRSVGQEERVSPELPVPITSPPQGRSKTPSPRCSPIPRSGKHPAQAGAPWGAGAPWAHPPRPTGAQDPAGLSHPAPHREDAPSTAPSRCPATRHPWGPPQLPQARRSSVVPCPSSHPEQEGVNPAARRASPPSHSTASYLEGPSGTPLPPLQWRG